MLILFIAAAESTLHEPSQEGNTVVRIAVLLKLLFHSFYYFAPVLAFIMTAKKFDPIHLLEGWVFQILPQFKMTLCFLTFGNETLLSILLYSYRFILCTVGAYEFGRIMLCSLGFGCYMSFATFSLLQKLVLIFKEEVAERRHESGEAILFYNSIRIIISGAESLLRTFIFVGFTFMGCIFVHVAFVLVNIAKSGKVIGRLYTYTVYFGLVFYATVVFWNVSVAIVGYFDALQEDFNGTEAIKRASFTALYKRKAEALRKIKLAIGLGKYTFSYIDRENRNGYFQRLGGVTVDVLMSYGIKE